VKLAFQHSYNVTKLAFKLSSTVAKLSAVLKCFFRVGFSSSNEAMRTGQLFLVVAKQTFQLLNCGSTGFQALLNYG
jgi:hypothetical protein